MTPLAGNCKPEKEGGGVKKDCENILKCLKSLGPIGRKFHAHGENDGFVLYEYLIKLCNCFCKYTNISLTK